ncbi:hypothetical protein PoB_005721100 [Plakobranchus ocellatus]|uniref:Uncharacterized protein n=1 Tax=Plakobranchus ocellatus TaxID=259542 RepID=A0AAV4CH30_9GAST|nr:hypothetical protein PoB_005721100 [Plakobranchus ocellatus]
MKGWEKTFHTNLLTRIAISDDTRSDNGPVSAAGLAVVDDDEEVTSSAYIGLIFLCVATIIAAVLGLRERKANSVDTAE